MASLPNAYLPIGWFPEYQTFSYHFDYVTVIIILSFICFIPSVFATVQMILFYLKSSTQNGSNVIHPYVFKSFLCMQSCNIIATALDYIVNRISFTTLVTSYIATMKSEIIIRYLIAALYAFNYMSQLYTVLFCFIRVLVLFHPRTHSDVSVCSVANYIKSNTFQICSVIFKVCNAVGIQLDIPFQYGAITLTTTFASTNRLQTIGDAVFSSIVTFCIITTALLMIIKMKTLKLVDQNSKLKEKAETTLKITMCIILLPSMMTQIFAVRFRNSIYSKLLNRLQMTCFWASSYVSYILLVRMFLVDFRVNIVSCYFYWNHPCFKQTLTPKPVGVKSLSTIFDMTSLPNAYLPIQYFPEYQTVSYHFDRVTVIVILSFICFIPSVFATVKMLLFYLKTGTRNGSKELHTYVFKSFLCMQFCNIIATSLDFFVYRIPFTTLMTSYFATIKSEIIIRYLVAAHYAFDYISQLYTVLFCFIRVLVLFYPLNHSEICSVIFKLWSLVTCLFSSAVFFPNILSKAIGFQLDFPFQYGAIAFTTTFAYTNRLQTVGDVVFSAIVTFGIVTMTLLMIIKMKTLKIVDQNSKIKAKAETTLKITMCIILIPSMTTEILTLDIPFQYGAIAFTTTFPYTNRLQNIGDAVFSTIVTFCIVTMTLVMIIKMKTLKLVDQNSKIKAKAETTLKITMCIILLPSTMSQIFAMACFYATRYASYIILVRPILLDCRVNIVSCYFYWTHPYFKQRKMLNSVNVKSLSTN
ncbi:hypothetical protein CRE_09288 [Caenorhabditis remanei]|uniref:Uncharacterized protein n=1 Tax=Caenorhabditis remanei TaxID=31234 RepID=E3LI04_CAERE|nr:hypothetical protein CRE_09288 [Caenorhabditis remanei]